MFCYSKCFRQTFETPKFYTNVYIFRNSLFRLTKDIDYNLHYVSHKRTYWIY